MNKFRVKDQILKKEFQQDFFDDYDGYSFNEAHQCWMPDDGNCNCHHLNFPPCHWCTSALESPEEFLINTLDDFPEMFESVATYEMRKSAKLHIKECE